MKKIILLLIIITLIYTTGCVKDDLVSSNPPPVTQKIWLNEFLATSATAQPDWIEIVNTGNDTVSLKNYVLSDSTRTGAWAPYIIGDVKIPPKGFKQFVNGTDFSFGLGTTGEGIRLYDTSWTVIDSYYWSTSQTADRTTGRIPDGTGAWTSNLPPTPGASNHTK